MVNTTLKDVESLFKPRIFRRAALKRFIEAVLLDIDPRFSVSSNALEYFTQIFTKFILEKYCFEFWKIKNDQIEYEGWPEAVKMDHFIEQCWTKKYDNELTFLYR